MKYRHETLRDISADIKSIADRPYDVIPSVYHPTFSPTIRGMPIQDYLRELANRIDTAGKRSEDTWMAMLKSGNRVERGCDAVTTMDGNSIAADVIAELCGDPSIADEVRDRIANETVDEVLAEMDGSAVGRHWAARIKAARERERGDSAKLLKTVDLRFDTCRDIEQVLKIGRDYQNKDGYRGAHYDTVKLLCDTIEYQQEQLKAKTEVGDNAKLREALEMVRDAHYTKEVDGELYEGFEVEADDGTGRPLICVVEDALASPQRNCDVGTPREQNERFTAFCASHYRGAEAMKVNDGPCDCPCWDDEQGCNCFVWAQMPYKEVGGK